MTSTVPANADGPNEGWTVQNASGRATFSYQPVGNNPDFLSTELPNATLQAGLGITQAQWKACSGNANNVNVVGTKTASAPTVACVAANQVAYGNWRVLMNAQVTAGYPESQVTFDWGEGLAPSLRAYPPYQAAHKYMADGTYTVTVTAANGAGGTNSVTRTVTVTSGNAVFS